MQYLAWSCKEGGQTGRLDASGYYGVIARGVAAGVGPGRGRLGGAPPGDCRDRRSAWAQKGTGRGGGGPAGSYYGVIAWTAGGIGRGVWARRLESLLGPRHSPPRALPFSPWPLGPQPLSPWTWVGSPGPSRGVPSPWAGNGSLQGLTPPGTQRRGGKQGLQLFGP